MNLYFELLKYPVFSIKQVTEFYSDIEAARSAIKRLMKKELVQKIRNNLYTCVSGETGSPVANRFQIASKITESSCVSHHTAAEYYGITNQVYYDVYVSSNTRFNEFEFDGYKYIYVPSKVTDGIDYIQYNGGIKVTDKERTIIDCIKDMDKISGIEEVIATVEMMTKVDEKKLLHYMSEYNNKFLYQKAGYILGIYKENMTLTDSFFNECKEKIGKSVRYLTKDSREGKYIYEWKLVVPNDIEHLKNKKAEHRNGIQ